MTNPNPTAPKTDTPAIQEGVRECAHCGRQIEMRKGGWALFGRDVNYYMCKANLCPDTPSFGCHEPEKSPPYPDAQDDLVSDDLEQLFACHNSEYGNGTIVYLIERIRLAESTLAAERASLTATLEERDRAEKSSQEWLQRHDDLWTEAWRLKLELHDLRASRLQAETEQFSAGIEAAATHAETSEVMLPIEKCMGTKREFGAAVALSLAEEIRALKRPRPADEKENT